MASKKNIKAEYTVEDGSTYDFSNAVFSSFSAQEDKLDYLMNREGRFKTIREMVGSEAIVGAFKNLVESTVCSEKYKMKPSDTSDEAKYYSDLIWDMLNDCEKPLVEYIKDWTSAADYGFCLSEIVWKKRLGEHPEDPRKHSRYNDGFIAPRKFAPRPQETISSWNYDKYKRIESVEQAVNYTSKNTIPYSKLLHFTVKSYNDNPEGVSVFKNLIYNFIEKKKIKKIQLIRFARGIDGIPVIYMPPSWMDKRNTEYASIRSAMEQFVKNVRKGQDSGIVLPMVKDSKGNDLLEFKIEGSASGVGENADVMIARCDSEMATSLLSDFFIGGSGASISGSLGQIKIDVFTNFVLTILNNITGQINHRLIPMIFEFNGWDKQYMPTLIHSGLSKFKSTNMMLFIQSLKASRLLQPSFERDNAISELVFDETLPPISREDWERGIQQQETNYIDNLDNITVDNFDDVSGNNKKDKEDK